MRIFLLHEQKRKTVSLNCVLGKRKREMLKNDSKEEKF